VRNLAAVDLNLLLAFEALLIERNVSRAADRLGVVQPTMSRSLAQLRAVFDDELFVRTPKEMRPTDRALALAGPIGEALEQIRRAFELERSFDPVVAKRRFTIGGTYYANFTMIPRFVERLRQDAPGVDVNLQLIGVRDAGQMLDDGQIDLALGILAELPKRFRICHVAFDRCVCISRRGHPALRHGLDLDTFAGIPHVRFSHSPDPGEEVDDALARCHRQRRVAFVMPSFYALVLAVSHSDLLAVVPKGVAQVMMLQESIGIHPIPLALSEWPISVAWAKAGEQDAGIRWVRDFFCKLYAVPEPQPA
jgi:DNA-binding transcriptional LysR family regulator